MRCDHFEIIVDPTSYVRWPGGGGYQPAEIRINGQSLLELVRVAESPCAAIEFRARVAAGEDPATLSILAGLYLPLPTSMVLLPNRNLLDQPREPGFELDAGDPRQGKATVFGCTCGIIDCWFLQVRIELGEGWVRWSDFSQFHRDWRYDLGPFTFERRQYESQLEGSV